MKKVLGIIIILSIIFTAMAGMFFITKQNIEQNRQVYVYSLDDVLLKTDIVEQKQKFDDEIVKLNEELLNTEKKIKSIKEAKVKADFSEVYLKNLRIKRDELIENYKKSIEDITQKINTAIDEIIKEKNIPVVFFKNAVATKTPYVTDLTDEIVERIKK